MTNERGPRYPGTRWALLYGSYVGPERSAVNDLHRVAQRFLPYVLEVREVDEETAPQNSHLLLVGTVAGNDLINQLVQRQAIAPPSQPEGFTIAYLDSPWGQGKKMFVVVGTDPSGVLYGVQALTTRIPGNGITPDDSSIAFDDMPPFEIHEHPRIRNRGIWSWGYVIYDYRRFIDNMVRLKLNMLTIWNDCPPLNCAEVIRYAHDRGVRIILGFHWGWGLEGLELGNPEHRRQISSMVLREYEQNYRGLGMDGIYFQTITEVHKTQTNGGSISSAACALVNDISSALFEKEPDLYIQFGLHAMSILDNVEELHALDPRIVIAWEDAGVVPYSYNPLPEYKGAGWATPKSLDTYEKTLEYSRRLATLRDGHEFAMVPKGWTSIDWENEFEHHGPFILGERDASFIRKRLEEKQSRWDEVNALWKKHYQHALHFYREMLACSPSSMSITGLIEDGVFEEYIQPSVVLFAEMLWNPHQDEAELLGYAQAFEGG